MPASACAVMPPRPRRDPPRRRACRAPTRTPPRRRPGRPTAGSGSSSEPIQRADGAVQHLAGLARKRLRVVGSVVIYASVGSFAPQLVAEEQVEVAAEVSEPLRHLLGGHGDAPTQIATTNRTPTATPNRVCLNDCHWASRLATTAR